MTDGINSEHKQEPRPNPPMMQDQPGDVDSRPPGGMLETVQVDTDEVEALRITNQRLLRELEQLTRQIQRPQEMRQAQKGQNRVTQEEQHLDSHREADREGETCHTREHGPYQPLGEDHNEERHGKDNKGDGPILY